MKYAVISPNEKLICFDHKDQVAEYCLETTNHALNDYCKDQEFTYETMTPTEIGQAYLNVSAVSGGCRIYETRDILNAMKVNDTDEETIDETNTLFNNRRLNGEIDCPGYIEDILGEITPIPIVEMSTGFYTCTNIDSRSPDNG